MKIINKTICVGDRIILKDFDILTDFFTSKGLGVSTMLRKERFEQEFIVVEIMDKSNYKFIKSIVNEFEFAYKSKSVNSGGIVFLYDFEIIKIS